MFAVVAILCGRPKSSHRLICRPSSTRPALGNRDPDCRHSVWSGRPDASTLHVIRKEHERVFGGMCLQDQGGPLMPRCGSRSLKREPAAHGGAKLLGTSCAQTFKPVRIGSGRRRPRDRHRSAQWHYLAAPWRRHRRVGRSLRRSSRRRPPGDADVAFRRAALRPVRSREKCSGSSYLEVQSVPLGFEGAISEGIAVILIGP